MKDHYDFSQSVKNPYFEDLQESITPQTTMTMTLNQKQLDILKAIKKLKLLNEVVYLATTLHKNSILMIPW